MKDLKSAIKILSKIKNKEHRQLAAKMWFTADVIRRMEEYHRWRYGN